MVKKTQAKLQNVKASVTPSDRASAAAALAVLLSYFFGVDVPVDVAAFVVFALGLVASIIEKKKASR